MSVCVMACDPDNGKRIYVPTGDGWCMCGDVLCLYLVEFAGGGGRALGGMCGWGRLQVEGCVSVSWPRTQMTENVRTRLWVMWVGVLCLVG